MKTNFIGTKRPIEIPDVKLVNGEIKEFTTVFVPKYVHGLDKAEARTWKVQRYNQAHNMPDRETIKNIEQEEIFYGYEDRLF